MSWRTQWRKCRHCGAGYRDADALHQHVRVAHPPPPIATATFVRYKRNEVPLTPIIDPMQNANVLEHYQRMMQELSGAPPVVQGERPMTATEVVMRQADAERRARMYGSLADDQRRFLAERLLRSAGTYLQYVEGMGWVDPMLIANENSHEE